MSIGKCITNTPCPASHGPFCHAIGEDCIPYRDLLDRIAELDLLIETSREYAEAQQAALEEKVSLIASNLIPRGTRPCEAQLIGYVETARELVRIAGGVVRIADE